MGEGLYCRLTIARYYQYMVARGIMVIIAGYGHDDTSSNPGQD